MRAGRPLRAGPTAPRGPSKTPGLGPLPHFPRRSRSRALTGLGAAGRGWARLAPRAPGAEALGASEPRGWEAGRPYRAPPADSPHTPLPTLFPFYLQQEKQQVLQPSHLLPRPPPQTPTRLRLEEHRPRCLWMLHPAFLQNKCSFYTKENNQIKILGAHNAPRPSTVTHPTKRQQWREKSLG